MFRTHRGYKLEHISKQKEIDGFDWKTPVPDHYGWVQE